MRRPIVLFCSQTGERYLTTKNKANTPDRLRLLKYSAKLRRRGWFVEE